MKAAIDERFVISIRARLGALFRLCRGLLVNAIVGMHHGKRKC